MDGVEGKGESERCMKKVREREEMIGSVGMKGREEQKRRCEK
jgi:hypothetical protein